MSNTISHTSQAADLHVIDLDKKKYIYIMTCFSRSVEKYSTRDFIKLPKIIFILRTRWLVCILNR
jgi:hypothetical protein